VIFFNPTYQNIITVTALTAKCKKCGMEFEDKDRLERHKKVHGRKSKVSEADAMDFNQVGV